MDHQPTPWHALAADAVYEQQHSNPSGLSERESVTRLTEYGPNELPQRASRTLIERLWEQFNNVLIYVLLVAALVSLLMGHWIDSALIAGVVVINALIGLIQEGKAEKALESIRGLIDPKAAVIREGETHTIDSSLLVPGDLVVLKAGDRVPADLRLVHTSNLTIDDALLTGESLVVTKQVEPVASDAALGDQRSMAFWGTLVATGTGRGIVVETGAHTQLGQISTLIDTVTTLKTPLIKQMSQFSKQLTGFILVLSTLTFVLTWLFRDYAVSDIFMAVVGLAVAAIPEGLPAIMTITLAIGVQRMAQHNAIIRKLPAVETLGSITVICSDKTGTLTCNEMMVQHLQIGSYAYRVTGHGYTPTGEFFRDEQRIDPGSDPSLMHVLKALALNNDGELRPGAEQITVEGSPTESALLSVAAKAGLNPTQLRAREPRIDDIPFDSSYKFMATRHALDDTTLTLIKGAPEAVLRRCQSVQTDQGVEPLDADAWHQQVAQLASRGNRVLAIAAIEGHPLEDALTLDSIEHGLTLLGLVGLVDPPREEAIQAVAQCHTAGIRTVMITGDHALTACEIAKQLGLSEDPVVCTGTELDAADASTFLDLARRVDVFARTTPEHKLRIVTALQELGEVTAMTGDGVNDAPALKRAEVGIAMGNKGTEAAKEASEMILADDNFATIVQAIREGRTVFDNITKVIAWTLPTNGGQAMTIVAALLLGMTLPITPVQILWVNMVSAVALGLTLAFEPTEKNALTRPPLPPSRPILDQRLLWQIGFVSVLFVLGTFGVFQWSIGQGHAIELTRALVVNTLIAMEIVYLFSVRYAHSTSLTREGLQGTKAVWLGIMSIAVLQALFTWAPPFQFLFGTTGIDGRHIVMILGVALTVFVILELEKAAWSWLRLKA